MKKGVLHFPAVRTCWTLPPLIAPYMRASGRCWVIGIGRPWAKLASTKPLLGVLVLKQASYDMDVSKNSGTPKSSILIGFSIINHPFWGTPIFGNTHMHILDLTEKTPTIWEES